MDKLDYYKSHVSSGVESTVLSVLTVRDCSESWMTFNHLRNELKTVNTLAMTVFVEIKSQLGNIGRAILGRRKQVITPGKVVSGIALCFGNFDVFYMPLTDLNQEVSLASRMTLLVDLIKGNRELILCGASEQIKALNQCLDLTLTAPLCDPLVAEWLLKPPLSSDVNLYSLVCSHCSLEHQLLRLVGLVKNVRCASLAWLKSCIDVVCTWHVSVKLNAKLKAENLSQVFYDVEMAVVPILARMDLRGLCISEQISRDIFDQLATLSVNNDSKLVAYNNTIRKVMVGLGSGTVHTTSVTNTSTGRIVTHSPNIQCIPDSNKIAANDPRFPHRVSVRSVIHAPKGQVFVSADFCQLELRILAHFSCDKQLIDVFKQSGDVFCRMAANWLNCPMNEVTELHRNQIKQACYGIIYGMGSRSLGDKLNVDEEQANEIMKQFMQGFPGIATFLRHTLKDCADQGYVETISRRRRYLPDILSNNSARKSHAERCAINTTIQGSAADIFKKAMILVDKQLKHGHLVLHIHDELICQVDQDMWKDTALILKHCMEKAVELKVPLPVKIQMGCSWADLTPIHLDL